MALSDEDLRSDIVQALSALLGHQRAEESVTAFENLVRKRAEEGANRVVTKGVYVNAALIIGVFLLKSLFRGRDGA